MAGSFSEEHEFEALVETIQAALRELTSAQDVRGWLKKRMEKICQDEKKIITKAA